MPFPTIPTTAAGRLLATNQQDASGTRTFPNLSSLTKSSGDLLIAIAIGYQSSGTANAIFSGWGGGFTEFVDQMTTSGSTMCIGAAYKWSTGSESGTFTVTQAATVTGHATMILMAIPGAHASTIPEATAIANGTSTAADPAALDPANWAAEDTLWVAVAGNGEVSTSGAWGGIGGGPTNYTGYYDVGTSADTAGAVDAAVAFRQLNAASENVGTFSVDTSNARNSALLIAVRPQALTPVDGAVLDLVWDTVAQVNANASTLKWDMIGQVNAAASTLKWDIRDLPDVSDPYAQLILAAAPQAYYRFGETDMGMEEATAQQTPLTVYTEGVTRGVTSLLAGLSGGPDKAVALDGSSYQTPNQGGMEHPSWGPFTLNFTWTFEFMAQSTAGQRDSWTKTMFADGNDLVRFCLGSGANQWDVSYTAQCTGGTDIKSWTNAWPSDGVPHHVAFKYVGTAHTIELFIDGYSKGVHSGLHNWDSAMGKLSVGRGHNGDHTQWAGVLDDFSIVFGAVSATTIKTHADTALGRTEVNGPVLDLKWDINSGVLARKFVGADGDRIYCSIGACNITGAYTMAALIRRVNNDNRELFINTHTSGGALKTDLSSGITPDNLHTLSSNVHSQDPVTMAVEDGWVIAVVSKASGLVYERCSIFRGGNWYQGQSDYQGGNQGETPDGTVRFADLTGIAWSNLEIAAAAIWTTNLSDAQVQELSDGLSAGWLNNTGAAPAGLWRHGYDSPLVDLTGNGADQSSISGTTIIESGPPDFDFTIPVDGPELDLVWDTLNPVDGAQLELIWDVAEGQGEPTPVDGEVIDLKWDTYAQVGEFASEIIADSSPTFFGRFWDMPNWYESPFDQGNHDPQTWYIDPRSSADPYYPEHGINYWEGGQSHSSTLWAMPVYWGDDGVIPVTGLLTGGQAPGVGVQHNGGAGGTTLTRSYSYARDDADPTEQPGAYPAWGVDVNAWTFEIILRREPDVALLDVAKTRDAILENMSGGMVCVYMPATGVGSSDPTDYHPTDDVKLSIFSTTATWTAVGINTDETHRLAIRVNPTSSAVGELAADTAELFIDGVSKGTRAMTGDYSFNPSGLHIGGSNSSEEGWTGTWAEPRFYDSVLDAETITKHDELAIGTLDSSLTMKWDTQGQVNGSALNLKWDLFGEDAVQFVQGDDGQSGASSTTLQCSLAATPTAGNLLVFCMAGDKNTGALTLSGFTEFCSLQQASASLYIWWKVSNGTEQTINPSWANTSAAGNTAWYAEYKNDGVEGSNWQVLAGQTHISDDSTVTSWSTGTTGTPSKKGIAIAAEAIDSSGSVT